MIISLLELGPPVVDSLCRYCYFQLVDGDLLNDTNATTQDQLWSSLYARAARLIHLLAYRVFFLRMGTFVIYTLINSGKGFGKRRSKQHKQRTGEQLRSIWEHQLVSGPLFTNQRSYFMVRWTAHLRSNSLQRQNDWVVSYQYNSTFPSSHVLAIWCRNQWEWESTKFVVLYSQKN